MDVVLDNKEDSIDNEAVDTTSDIFISHLHSCLDDTSSGQEIAINPEDSDRSVSEESETEQVSEMCVNESVDDVDDEAVQNESSVSESDQEESDVDSDKQEPTSQDRQESSHPVKGQDSEVKELFNKLTEFIKTKDDFKEESASEISVVPTGIDVLDCILGGGFAMGKLNCIVGRTGCGKTMLAIQTLANAQRIYKNPLILYLDSEESVSRFRLYSLGVNKPTPTPYTSLTVEKVFKLIEALCLFKENENIKEPSFIVWDSIANTLSEKEMEADDPNSVIGYRSRLFSILIPKYVQKCSSHNITILAINQLRDKIQIGPYASPSDLKFLSYDKVMPGGNVLQFNIFHLLEMKTKSVLREEQYGFAGVTCEVKTVKNKLFPPNIPVQLVGSFVTGFDNFYTNYIFLTTHKFLQAGAWNYLKSYPTKKFRTKDAKAIYDSDSSFRQAFDESVKEALKVVIEDPYGI